MAELAHASENDSDLHGDTSARNWAERFVHHVMAKPAIASDEGTMLAWFAGAIETGRQEGMAAAQARDAALADSLIRISMILGNVVTGLSMRPSDDILTICQEDAGEARSRLTAVIESLVKELFSSRPATAARPPAAAPPARHPAG